MIKAIVFDMDGVLIDAREWHYEALNLALKHFGVKIERYDHLVTYDGLPTREKLDMLTSLREIPKELHELVSAMKQKHTMNFVHQLCAPNFTHQYAISELKRHGYRLAVASNSIAATIETMLSKASLLDFFEFYLSAEHVTQGKPSPEIYLKAIEKLDCVPSEVLILEDNPHGIRAAEESGAHVLKVNDVAEVNYINIVSAISSISKGGLC